MEELVDATFSDIQSQFLVLPRGDNFVEYREFQSAYEVLRRRTSAFADFSEGSVWAALRENSLCLVVVRTMLGISPPEWADLARSDRSSDITQGYARSLEGRCRSDRATIGRLVRPRHTKSLDRIDALVSVAVEYIARGAPPGAADTVHRLDKVDTFHGLESLRHVASQHVPYAMLLYERYLGRPFATHRDAVSELVGDTMETAIEELLTRARITFRKTKRAENIPGYDQVPDFLVPDEFNPSVVIEAKITGDDGTARDKVARIERLTRMRDDRRREGQPDFEVVACIDGRGFGVRREDMRSLITRTEGKVFTLTTLDQMVAHTRLKEFLPSA
ncbi:MAG: hypothetical protein OYI31_06480 [Chloroflexota bacterium]|nr:hypothetical protein [Chloroflexota bacterium]MDE2942362.1 hypothetical protein [Chloroflexota bacterium]MDE3268077.1 hypothetical protein [Chloroflexota bacterium]